MMALGNVKMLRLGMSGILTPDSGCWEVNSYHHHDFPAGSRPGHRHHGRDRDQEDAVGLREENHEESGTEDQVSRPTGEV